MAIVITGLERINKKGRINFFILTLIWFCFYVILNSCYFFFAVFEYKLFPNSDINKYESFVLRNSGNDWESTILRDGFITSLTDDLDIDHQRYRPAALYINGEFWGIQNIREKVSEHFISSNHSIGAEHIDLLDIQGVNDENIVHGQNLSLVAPAYF